MHASFSIKWIKIDTLSFTPLWCLANQNSVEFGHFYRFVKHTQIPDYFFHLNHNMTWWVVFIGSQLLEQSIALNLLLVLCLYTSSNDLVIKYLSVVLGLHTLSLWIARLAIPIRVQVSCSKLFALQVLESTIMQCPLAWGAHHWATHLLLHSIKPSSRGLCIMQRRVRLIEGCWT